MSCEARNARAATAPAGLALVALLAGCASGGGAPASPAVASRPVITDQQRGWLSLADGGVHVAGDDTPLGLYVAGVIEGGRFVPEGDVLGQGPIGTPGTPGWLDLLEGGFHPRQDGREPPRPCVEGTLTADGAFSPASRRVTY